LQYYLAGLAASAGIWLRAVETEISAAQWPLWLGKDFMFRLVRNMNTLLGLNICGISSHSQHLQGLVKDP